MVGPNTSGAYGMTTVGRFRVADARKWGIGGRGGCGSTLTIAPFR
jgi:hypothetical protein